MRPKPLLKNVVKTLYVCLSYCTEILQNTKSNILGYLTLVQHRLYQKDIKNTVKLHSSGFVIALGYL